VLCLLWSAAAAQAQERWFSLSYGVSFPTGETTDFTPDPNFASFTAEARQLVTRQFSLGLSWSFTELSDEVDEILDFRQLGFPDFDNVAGNLSGSQFRTINAMPLLVTAHFYPVAPPRKLIPYVGLGAGATFNDRRLNIGLTEFEDDSWGLSIMPEVGVLWWMSEYMAFGLDGKYNFDFADDFDVTYWKIDLGLAWQF
jgi:hypothetical protein